MHFKNENDIKVNSQQPQQNTNYHNQQQQQQQHQYNYNTPSSTSTSSTSSSTSSNDSGVIIIDNCTTIGNKKFNNLINNNQNNNNSNSNNIKNSYSNNTNNNNKINTHKNATNNANNNVYKNTATKVDIISEKFDNNTTTTIKPDNITNNEKFNNHKINQTLNNDDDDDVNDVQYDGMKGNKVMNGVGIGLDGVCGGAVVPDDNVDCNNDINKPKSINIENIIKITKSSIVDATTTNKAEVQQHQEQKQILQFDDCCIGIAGDSDGDGNNSSKKPSTTTTNSNTTNSTSKNCSPNLSIRSTSISIVSIDENAIDSSIIDSDSDCEADAEGVHTNYVVKKLGQQVTYPAGSSEVPNINKGLTVISQQISPNSRQMPDNTLNGGYFSPPPQPSPPTLSTKLCNPAANGAFTPVTTTTATPQIGSIALNNSTDVTFGDKNFFEGPVTIQQILVDKWKGGSENGGHDNPMFANESDYDASGSKAHKQPETPSNFFCKRKAITITAIIVVLTIVIGIILLTTLKTQSKLHYGVDEDSRKNIPINSTIEKDNIGGGRVLRIVARDGWLAQPPSSQLVPLDLPIRSVVVIATQTDICTTQAACTYRVRFIQTFNIESQQKDDIIYNFLIGGDGNVYEGRGWDFRGAHLKGYNNETISFAYIGTFREQSPNLKQMEVTKLLLDDGVKQNKLTPDYKIYAATKFDATSLETASSKALYDSFKSWSHWSD